MKTDLSSLRAGVLFGLGVLLTIFAGIGAYAAYSTLSVDTNDTLSASKWNELTTYTVPPGAVMAFNLTACPSGWGMANGTNGTPDLRGEFVRGWDGTGALAKGIDPGRTIASSQGATRIRELIDNYSGYPIGTLSIGAGNIEYGMDTNVIGNKSLYASLNNSAYYHSSTTAQGGSGDNNAFGVRPRNVALLYCIKN